MEKKDLLESTICVHTGTNPSEFGDVNTPVYTSTAYEYLDTDDRLYPRYFNIPNQKTIIDKLSKLEHAESGLVFSSGMAAISTTLLSLLQNGDHVIIQNGLYGGTLRFILEDFERFGISYTLLQKNDENSFKNAIKNNTKAVYVETPSNPLLKIVDLSAIAEICKKHNLISIIDNTFASPINQNPIDFGIDIVLHSATKYIGGHHDIQAGVMLSNKNIVEKIKSTAFNLGGSINPLMCYLLERSIKTLSIRVKKQTENALKMAEYLNTNEKIDRVYYPGLSSHENYKIAREQMKGFGAMLSFEIKGKCAYEFQKKLKLIKPTISLGGVQTTICSPSLTSNRHMTAEQKKENGIKDTLLRLSLGIEDVEDLILDIENAINTP